MYVLDVLAISMWIHQPAVRHSDKVHSRNRLITAVDVLRRADDRTGHSACLPPVIDVKTGANGRDS